MSKPSVGEVYAKVIKDVVDLSRIDFEEGGVEASALELLQSEWQSKLSALGLTALPWDPQPLKEEKSSISNNIKQQTSPSSPLPSNGSASRQQPQSQSTLNTLPPTKSEPSPYPSQQPTAPTQQFNQLPLPQGRPMEAQQRAAQLLQGRFGDQASQQVARLNGTIPAQSIPQQSGPYIKEEEGASLQYNQPIKTDQTDGSNDDYDTWQAEYARRKMMIEKDRSSNDTLIRDHVMASQQHLEGGGLLIPLEERRQVGSQARRALAPSSRPESTLVRAQGDAGDDDEDDEDAINSDLDDPDELDELGQEGDEEPGKVMLCTYDKVQRVKNKWKCTLKDGILRIDGTEYLFHKGQGEFEW